LSELLDLPEHADPQQTNDSIGKPLLTWRDEQTLLKAAHQVGTPTLAPVETALEFNSAPSSFISDLAGVALKYPVPAVLAAGGLAFLLARRRR
jgi:hypothetical protein